MNLRRTIIIAKKEFIHIKRDPRSLIFCFLIPVVLIMLFGYALSLDIEDIRTAVLDYDKSNASREFIERFESSGYFTITHYAFGYEQLEEDIKSGRNTTAIVIPPGFESKLLAGEKANVQTIIDGSIANTASITLGYIEMVSNDFSTQLAIEESLFSIEQPLDYSLRFWYNQELESKNFIIPGLVAVIMMIIASLLTSLVIAREWENGTMERLIVSPIQSQELIIGKVIPYYVIGIFDLGLIAVLGIFVFNVPFRGSILLLFLLSSIFLIGALFMGITISIITKSQLLSYQIAMMATFLPSYILSGLVFPIASMPAVIQYISYIVPARYFITISRGIFLKGSGISVVYMEAIYLTVFAIIMFIIANRKFEKKLK